MTDFSRNDSRSSRVSRRGSDRRGTTPLNEYLYGELESTYPALRAIARTRRYIERYRRGDFHDEAAGGDDGDDRDGPREGRQRTPIADD